MILHHYTPLENLESILKSRKLRFSNFQNTNDYEEYIFGLSLLYPIFKKQVKTSCQPLTDAEIELEYRNLVKLFKESLNINMSSFLFCLCQIHKDKYTNCGLLSMWRSYADEGRGVAIEFITNNFIDDILLLEKELLLKFSHKVNYKSDISSFEKMLKLVLKKSQIEKIRHQDPKKSIRDMIQQLIKILKQEEFREEVNLDLATCLMVTSMFFKHPGFHEESEYRIVISGNMSQEVNFRAEKINKIIIGPGSKEDTDAIEYEIKNLLKLEKLDNIKVIKSDIPYIAPRRHITIRAATFSDAESIAKVGVDSWRKAYAKLLSSSILANLSVQDNTKGWQEIIENKKSDVLVAVIQQKIVGFVSFGSYRGSDTNNSAEIYAIYIHPDYWGQKIGAALLNTAIRAIVTKKFDYLALWVFNDNRAARSFYESNGFTVTYETKQEIQLDNLLEVKYLKRL